MANDLESGELRGLAKLVEVLANKSKAMNSVLFSEFRKYIPLFVASNDQHHADPVEVGELSADFMTRFDPYMPITVFDGNGEILFKVPQLFVPIVSINEKHIAAVNHYRSNNASDVPKYASEASNGLLVAILKSQKESAVDNGFASYADFIKSVSKTYHQDIKSFGVKNVVIPKTVTSNNEVDDGDDPVTEDNKFLWE